jgi:hypothetical protein
LFDKSSVVVADDELTFLAAWFTSLFIVVSLEVSLLLALPSDFLAAVDFCLSFFNPP